MEIKHFLLCSLLVFTSTLSWAEEKTRVQQPSISQNNTITNIEETGDKELITMLHAVFELKKRIQQQIKDKQEHFSKDVTEDERHAQLEEIRKLQESFAQANNDFEKIATGVDISKFHKTEQSSFDWKKEISSLMQPGILELKRLTVEARKKTDLLSQKENYQELLPIAQKANENLKNLLHDTDDNELKKQITTLIPDWKSLEDQLKNGLDITNMELAKMERNKKSLLDSGKNSLKIFFKTRGLYLTIGLISCLGIILLLRLLHISIRRALPGSQKEYRPILVRIVDLTFQILALLAGISSFVLVFYFFEDWLLLSFAIIFLAGLGWATKTALPKFWQQSQMMLNLGNVREGERVVLYGVPWLIKNINVRTKLENPALGITMKVPIKELFDKASRTFDQREPWFPCRKDDWVILSDGTRGGVVSLSHEQVELVLRGGAHKIYQTQDFLKLAPLNLSRNFRIKEVFGISYNHQKEATSTLLTKLEEFLIMKFENDGYAEHLLNLRVELNSAGASSLDLVIIADFRGSQAPLYNRFRRAIQRWCVEACTQYSWEIPFPQLTVHKGEYVLD